MILIHDLLKLKGGLEMKDVVVELIYNQTIYIRKSETNYNCQFELGYWISKDAYLNKEEPFQTETVYSNLSQVEAQDIFNVLWRQILLRYTDYEVIPNE